MGVDYEGDAQLLQSRGAPWFPVWMIHPLVVGALRHDPVYAKRLFLLSDRVCPRQMTKAK